ncbi:hypothetical protein AWJ20_3355 [Sugiyamaella lignohabitans]|uniref:FAD dependent oxidoreductase domain-containing protein n=1 Tax=Sugiyamaella lignohabitans TaxID=796027 RepID=A0A167FUG4_9ASCO|nr:uncharacterized protein AWJ20_3355 [Sugiyamaella lignohabitans]ANB15716.1 hypothetical protein AWJ20_3355 [Sugiyamaella lignohabitans]
MIIVIGSGVVGLSTAVVLAGKGYRVLVIADWFPGDPEVAKYASPWAGAHFRPFPSFSAQDLVEKGYTRETLAHFETLAVAHPESSIKFIQGVEYIDCPTNKHLKGEGYEDIPHFKCIDPNSEGVPNGTKFACSYRTWVLDPPKYLEYLHRKLQFEQGVRFYRKRLGSLREAYDVCPGSKLIVNATGKGLQWNGGYDPECFSIRGQTLLVRGPYECPLAGKTITHQPSDGKWTFVIPRPLNGGYIIGGTKQVKDEYPSVRDIDTDDLISRAKVLFPELLIDGSFDIQKINVGFRPARNGGFRLEKESLGNSTIIHAYGAGGMGYEMSHGIAMRIAELIQLNGVQGKL